MPYRRLFLSLAALLLLGLFASPVAANAQVEQDAPNAPADYVDTDGDGLSDEDEATYTTDPNNDDTDGDGYGDNQEVVNGSDPRDETSVPANAQPGADTDGDLLSDETEIEIGTDPTKPDTDADQLTDFAEVGFEPGSSTGTDPLKFDTDGDGLGDGAEYLPDGWGTNPLKIDTDDDGYNDGDELFVHKTDPKDASSKPATQGASTLIVEVRILPVEYQGNDFAGDSDPLPGVAIDVIMPGSDFALGGTTDDNGRVVVGGLVQGDQRVILGVPGDFASFITFFGNDSIPEPRQHEGQNTNSPVVYVAPGETLYGTFYVIPVDAKGDDDPAPAPAPSPAPQPQQPAQQPATPVKALPSTGSGAENAANDLVSTLTLFLTAGALLATAGAFGLARRRGEGSI